MEKNIKCKDCGKEFVCSSGEIRFYESKGLSLPVRCKSCRESKKKKQEDKEFFEKLYEKFKNNTIKINL